MISSHRGRVCHLTSDHRSHLWLHQRASGLHPARVSFLHLQNSCFFSLSHTHTHTHTHTALLNSNISSAPRMNPPSPFPLFPAYRQTTQRIAWRGISWPRGSWRLPGPGRSWRLPKAERQISTAERSGAARSMRRASRASTLVGTTLVWTYTENKCKCFRAHFPKRLETLEFYYRDLWFLSMKLPISRTKSWLQLQWEEDYLKKTFCMEVSKSLSSIWLNSLPQFCVAFVSFV